MFHLKVVHLKIKIEDLKIINPLTFNILNENWVFYPNFFYVHGFHFLLKAYTPLFATRIGSQAMLYLFWK
jgi:hypothetical protein